MLQLLRRKKSQPSIADASSPPGRKSAHSRKSSSSNNKLSLEKDRETAGPPTLPPLTLTPLYNRFATSASADGANGAGANADGTGVSAVDGGLSRSVGASATGNASLSSSGGLNASTSSNGYANTHANSSYSATAHGSANKPTEIASEDSGIGLGLGIDMSTFGRVLDGLFDVDVGSSLTTSNSIDGVKEKRASISRPMPLGSAGRVNGHGQNGSNVESNKFKVASNQNPYLPPNPTSSQSQGSSTSSISAQNQGTESNGIRPSSFKLKSKARDHSMNTNGKEKENKWKFDTDTETDTEETGTTETSTTNDEDTEAEKDDVEVYGKPDTNGTVGRAGANGFAIRSTSGSRGGQVIGSREREREKEKERGNGGVNTTKTLMTPPLSPEGANGAKERGRGGQRMGGSVKATTRSGSRQQQQNDVDPKPLPNPQQYPYNPSPNMPTQQYPPHADYFTPPHPPRSTNVHSSPHSSPHHSQQQLHQPAYILPYALPVQTPQVAYVPVPFQTSGPGTSMYPYAYPGMPPMGNMGNMSTMGYTQMGYPGQQMPFQQPPQSSQQKLTKDKRSASASREVSNSYSLQSPRAPLTGDSSRPASGHRKRSSLEVFKSRVGATIPSAEREREENERHAPAKLRKKLSREQWINLASVQQAIATTGSNNNSNNNTMPSSFHGIGQSQHQISMKRSLQNAHQVAQTQALKEMQSQSPSAIQNQRQDTSQDHKYKQYYQTPTPPTSRDGHPTHIGTGLRGAAGSRQNSGQTIGNTEVGQNGLDSYHKDLVSEGEMPLVRIASFQGQSQGRSPENASSENLKEKSRPKVTMLQPGKPLIFTKMVTESPTNEFEDVELEPEPLNLETEMGLKGSGVFGAEDDVERTVTPNSTIPSKTSISTDSRPLPSSSPPPPPPPPPQAQSFPITPLTASSTYSQQSSTISLSSSSDRYHEAEFGSADQNGIIAAMDSVDSKLSNATARLKPSLKTVLMQSRENQDEKHIRDGSVNENGHSTVRLVGRIPSTSSTSSFSTSSTHSTNQGQTQAHGGLSKKIGKKLQKTSPQMKKVPLATSPRPSISEPTATRAPSPPKLHHSNSTTSVFGKGGRSKMSGSLPIDTSAIDLATGESMAPDADPFARIIVDKTEADPASPVVFSNAMPLPKRVKSQSDLRKVDKGKAKEVDSTLRQPVAPPTPITPEEFLSSSRSGRREETMDGSTHGRMSLNHSKRPSTDDVPRNVSSASDYSASENELSESPSKPSKPTSFYPLSAHMTNPDLLAGLLSYFTFRDWCIMTEVNDGLRRTIEHKRDLREVVLERYLSTVGYAHWKVEWDKPEPIMLTFKDLNAYMRGVSVPSHEYAKAAKAYLEAKKPDGLNNPYAIINKSLLASSCRSYTRVVIRLRAQADAMAKEAEDAGEPFVSPLPAKSRSQSISRSESHAPSLASTNDYQARYRSIMEGTSGSRAPSETRRPSSPLAVSPTRFQSTLYRVGHAPLLRVFIPSPDGEWLSDESVLSCEKELKRAGVMQLLKVGDVVWDAAVGDESNMGRLVWDGNYLIDLDYTYSRMGELPKYLHSLAFPPSYFHRVIRASGNPICYIDLSPWSEEIAANLQLLQDRTKTDTPQGKHHTVVRWVHRSKFRIRPNGSYAIPSAPNLSIDPAWWGTVVVETEGTNEGLADLQERCSSAFPVRAGADPSKSASKVCRLLRERSRPGELWIRLVREKERIL